MSRGGRGGMPYRQRGGGRGGSRGGGMGGGMGSFVGDHRGDRGGGGGHGGGIGADSGPFGQMDTWNPTGDEFNGKAKSSSKDAFDNAGEGCT